MNKGIAHILMTKLTGLPYITKFGGLVAVQEEETMIQNEDDIFPKKVTKKYPVTADYTITDVRCAIPDGLADFTPDSSAFGILYFEDNGTEPQGRDGRFEKYRSRLRLVVWLNSKMVQDQGHNNIEGYLTTSAVMADIKRKFRELFNTHVGYYKRITVRERSIPAADKNIFSPYTFDLAATQFIMAPFEFFAMDLDVDFRLNPNCFEALAVSIANLECAPGTAPLPSQYPALEALMPYEVVLRVGIDTDTGFIVTPHPDKLKLNEVDIVSEVSVGNIDIQVVPLANDGTAFDFRGSAGEVTQGTITLTVKPKNNPALAALMPYQVKLVVGIDTNTGSIITPVPEKLKLDEVEILSDVVVGNIPYQDVPLTADKKSWDFTDSAGEINSGIITLTVRKKIQ